ncbi:MAG: arylsulfatase [Planctomycetota bacterium]|jgi:arylsulfatase
MMSQSKAPTTDASEPLLPPKLGAAIGLGLKSGIRVGLLVGIVDGAAALLRMLESIDPLSAVACIAGAVTVYSVFFTVGFALLGALLVLIGRGRLLSASTPPRFGVLAFVGLVLAIFFEVYWSTRSQIFWGYPALSIERIGAAAVMFAGSVVLVFGLRRLTSKIVEPLSRIALPVGGIVIAGGLFFLNQDRLLLSSNSEGDFVESNQDLPNVLLVMVDALRSDVIGAYGSENVKTPVMDQMAREGVLFENARVQAPFTWSSFGSFLTGKFPRRHGMLKLQAGMSWAVGINTTIPLHFKTAKRAEGPELKQDDFVTAAFMTGAVTAGSGLLLGIDLYCEVLKGHELVHRSSRWSLFSADLVIFNIVNKLTQRIDYNKAGTTAEKWLVENASDKRFFAMLHLYSTHTPYAPAPEFREMYVDPEYSGPINTFNAEHRYAIEGGRYKPTQADIQQIRNLYYGGVTQADHAIGLVLEELEQAGVLENTIVIVTSDHGEELGEHGLWEHNWMYQTNLEIPLIMRWPSGLPADKRVEALIDSVDIMPTLCDLMGLDLPNVPTEGPEVGYHLVDGGSLMPLIRGETNVLREFSFAESGSALAIQDLRWKLVVSRECLDFTPDDRRWQKPSRDPQLFDLVNDPDEMNNLFTPLHDEVLRLMGELRKWDESLPIPRSAVAASRRDLEAEELLDSLGYTGGIGGEDEPEPDEDE